MAKLVKDYEGQRAVLVLALLVTILGFFTFYIKDHPAIIETLKHIDPL